MRQNATTRAYPCTVNGRKGRVSAHARNVDAILRARALSHTHFLCVKRAFIAFGFGSRKGGEGGGGKSQQVLRQFMLRFGAESDPCIAVFFVNILQILILTFRLSD